ncbi:hypothetical protein PINS_up000338 [Pythium insidiosum]|nr:hypothetical protein PINS_up000338 [Pythium insidiosum]
MVDVIDTRERLLRKKAEAARVDRELEDKAKEAFRQKEAEKQARELKRQRIRVMKEKVAAWQLAHRIVPTTIAAAFDTLTQRGVFYDPLERDVTQWLEEDVFSSADVKLRLQSVASTLLDGMFGTEETATKERTDLLTQTCGRRRIGQRITERVIVSEASPQRRR